MVSLPQPAIEAPKSVRKRTVKKALDQEAERGVPANLGRVSSPFRHAESGTGGISGVPAATSPTKTVSPIHEPANPSGHVRGDTAQVHSLDTMSARTGVLTRRQQAILDVTVGGSQPTPALPHFERTLLVQSRPNPTTVEEVWSGREAARWDSAIKIELSAMEVLIIGLVQRQQNQRSPDNVMARLPLHERGCNRLPCVVLPCSISDVFTNYHSTLSFVCGTNILSRVW